MNSKLYHAWKGNVPPVQIICCAMPNSPELPLTGGGVSRKAVDDFLKNLEKDFNNQKGRYYAYVLDYYNSEDESDIYALETWQVFYPNDGTYEAVVILYYSALNPYMTIKKHMGEDLAEEYLAKNKVIGALSEVLS